MRSFTLIKALFCLITVLLLTTVAQAGDIRTECSNIHLKNNLELHGDCLDDVGQIRWGVWVDLKLYISNDNGFLTWDRSGGLDTSCDKFRLNRRGFYLSAKCEAFRNGGWTKVTSEIHLSMRIKVRDGWLVYDDFSSLGGQSSEGEALEPPATPPQLRISYGGDQIEEPDPSAPPAVADSGPVRGVPRGSTVQPEESIVVDRVGMLIMEGTAQRSCIPGISIVISHQHGKYWARVTNMMLTKGARRGGGQHGSKSCFFDLADQHPKPIELSRQRDPNDYNCWVFRGFKSRREFLRLRDRTLGTARCGLYDWELRDVFYGGQRYHGHRNLKRPHLLKIPRDVDSGDLFEVGGFDYIETGGRLGEGYLGDYNQRQVKTFVEFIGKNQLHSFKGFMADRNWHYIPTLSGYLRNYSERVIIGGEVVERPYMYVTNMKVSLRDYLIHIGEGP